ncbi:MAG: ribonuclease III [Oscillospiraceae bacterium]|jgi:ribonuclease-3|nr:ribonuclease III [Oscillospiraceae bacterium]
MTEFEDSIGYRFKKKQLLELALTHSSYAAEHGTEDNQRMEFLGDAVIDMVTARILYAKHPDAKEGKLTLMRADLVCEANLARAAEALKLWDNMRLGRGAKTAGPKPSILADAFEALTAAMYLDGGMDTADNFIRFALLGAPLSCRSHDPGGRDSKSRLQTTTQKGGKGQPRYETTYTDGPPHAPTYTSVVFIDEKEAGRGYGVNKKEAEKAAAKQALQKMRPK